MTVAAPPAIAVVSNLTVRYGARTALSDLNLTFPTGCVGLLGPNGAGKTTLLKTLLGFLAPHSGTATVLGHDVARDPLAIRRVVGLMPEMDCHIPGTDAVRFVAYAGELSGMPAANAMARSHEVLQYCGLGEARYRAVETYSTGMKQRIKLAQALVHGPKLLFLDEPTNGLDPAGREEMLDLIRDLSHGKGVDIIVSSHLLPDIERVCDSVVVMRQGQVATQGDLAELRSAKGRKMDVDLQFASEPFVAALTRRGGAVLHTLGSHYRVSLPDDGLEPGRFLFETAREAEAQLRGFRPHARSLEDIFMGSTE